MEMAPPGGTEGSRELLSRLIRSPARAFLVVFLVSAAVRCALLPLLPLDPAWQLRQENGATALWLIQNGEYANPYLVPTGPTAHPVPFYTAVIAASYRLFGVTRSSELARCVLAVVSFSVMYALLPWLAVRFGLGAPAGVLGGIAGALSPLHMSIGLLYGGLGEEFAALAMSLLLAASLKRWETRVRSIRGSAAIGLGWGASFHVSPALLPVMLGCAGFEAWWIRDRAWGHLAALFLGTAIACTPWAVRNYSVFHEFIFIRSNFGLELRMGNHEGAAADMEVADMTTPGRHPRTHYEEALKVQALGEMEYMGRARREAADWVAQNPLVFLRLTAERAAHFWLGSLHQPAVVAGTGLLTLLALLGARRAFPALSAPRRAVLWIPLVFFPSVYYLVCYMPRYRVPLDWLLLLLAGTEVSRWVRGKAVGDQMSHP